MFADWSYTLIFTTVVATLNSALCVGYSNGVINAPSEIIKQWIKLNIEERYQIEISDQFLDFLWSFIVAVFLIGGIIGSIVGGVLANNYGRRNALIIISFFNIFGATFFLITKSIGVFELLVIGRFLTGIAAGAITCVLPIYLIEISPENFSGVMGTICPLGINVGLLLAQVLGLNYFLGTSYLWPYLLSLLVITTIPTTIILFYLPKSPKFLYFASQDIEKVTKELRKLRSKNSNVLSEVNKIKTEFEQENQEKSDKWTLVSVVKHRPFLLPLLLVCSLQAGQQLSGINSVFFYSVSIFKKNKLSETGAQLTNIITGIFNLLMSIISTYTIKKFNRRPVIFISCIATIISLLVFQVTINQIKNSDAIMITCIISLISYIIVYGLGLGPIPYFIGSELFDSGPRPIAMGIGSMFNWGGNFLVAITFPTIYNLMGSSSFSIFVLAVLLLCIFLWMYLPETRNQNKNDPERGQSGIQMQDVRRQSELNNCAIEKF